MRRNREQRKAAHRANRRRQRGDNPSWRDLRGSPATDEQLEALRMMATASGKAFRLDVTRGEAWRRIREATTLAPAPRRRRRPSWAGGK